MSNILSVLMFFAMIAWGSTWVSAKILGNYITENELIFWRFLLSAIGLGVVMIFLKVPFRLDKKNSLVAIISGFILIAYNYFFFSGCYNGNAGFGGVLVTTLNPIITFILIWIITRGKSISKLEIFALLIGASGTLMMLEVWKYGMSVWQMDGTKWFLLAAATWPFLTIVSSKFSGESALTLSFYMFLIASFLDLVIFQHFQVSAIEKFDFTFWINLLLLSLFGTTFGTSVYFISTSKWGSKRASSYFFLVPFSAVIFAYIFLGEKLSIYTIIGGALSVIAIYLINGYNIVSLLKVFKSEARIKK